MPSFDHLRELAARDQVAIDEVDPGALVLLGMQPMERVRPAPDHLLRSAVPVTVRGFPPILLRSGHLRCLLAHSRRPEPTSAFGRPRAPAWPASSRAASAIWDASMPAAASSSAGVPDPGIDLTASFVTVGWGCSPREHVEHRVADAALRPVILDGDDRSGLASGGAHRLRVDRLDGVQVDHPRADAFLGQLLRGRQRLVERDAGADDRHDVVIGPRARRGCHRCGTPRPAGRGSGSSRASGA